MQKNMHGPLCRRGFGPGDRVAVCASYGMNVGANTMTLAAHKVGFTVIPEGGKCTFCPGDTKLPSDRHRRECLQAPSPRTPHGAAGMDRRIQASRNSSWGGKVLPRNHENIWTKCGGASLPTTPTGAPKERCAASARNETVCMCPRIWCIWISMTQNSAHLCPTERAEELF